MDRACKETGRRFFEKPFFTNLVENHFSKVSSVDFQIFQKLSENLPRISRKIIAHEFYQKFFPEFYNFPKFSENFENFGQCQFSVLFSS